MTGWFGCLGVRLGGLGPTDLPLLGSASGTPLVDATVRRGAVADPVGDLLWEVEGPVALAGGGQVDAYQALWRRPDGVRVLVAGPDRDAVLAVAGRSIVLATGLDDPAATQYLVAYALPLVLGDAGVLVLHGAAAALDGRALVVCGPSGRGKSSIVVGLVDAGWRAVTEDLCALDLRSSVPAVWPGPPWVRRRPDEPGPAGATVAFETADKVAWALGARQARSPATLAALARLEEPGGAGPEVHPVDTPAGLGLVGANALWFDDLERRAATQFGPAARVARAVPVWSVRFPRAAGWLADVPGIARRLVRDA